MNRNKQLYQFLLEKTWQLTEEWYQSLDKSDPLGVYASNDPEVIKTVKQQNYEFHQHFCKVFEETKAQFFRDFEPWILAIAQDKKHLETPLHFILREFFKTQEQYLDLIKEFVSLHEEKYSNEIVEFWNRTVIETFGKVITWFTQENHKYSKAKMEAQQEMINELSLPVIALGEGKGLLPLVGDIDTARAKFILENTLSQCVEKHISHLFIDLSGVVIVDTMVAHRIFQLIDTLDLIGVKSTLSGIRPEIAQTAVQLGISFEKISITSTLEQAINKIAKK